MNNEFINKSILILGFGKEGQSTYKFIRSISKDIILTIADANELIKENELVSNDKNVEYILGSDYLKSIYEYDLIIKSPGVSLKDINLEDIKGELSSETEIFMKYFKDQVIGVTGTKGKTTTVTVLYEVLKRRFDDVILVGNVGIPPFDVINKVTDKSIIVYELSSYQLQHLKVSPHISILLNVYQDHLNFHESFEEYYNSKFNIANYQNKEDYLIYNMDNLIINEYINSNNLKANLISLSQKEEKLFYTKEGNVFYKNEKIYNLDDKYVLIGEHNNYNLMAVLAVCNILNVDYKEVKEALSNYELKPHRLEFVKEINGVKFYNDSIATIPEATIAATKALKEVDTLMIGGFDRKIDYKILVDFINNSNIDNIICFYNTGKQIFDKLDKNKRNIVYSKDLEEATIYAKKVTKKICLFSPAAASFGDFKNFEERGDFFKNIINK